MSEINRLGSLTMELCFFFASATHLQAIKRIRRLLFSTQLNR